MADVVISDLSPITPSTGLVLPVSDGTHTGRVSLSQVCGVMTSAQITSALGYTPQPSLGFTPYNSTNPAGYITAASLPSSQQLIKAWGVFNGNNSIGTNSTIFNSYNINRIYKEGTGKYIVYFQNALPSKNYAVSGTAAKPDANDDANIAVQAGGFNGGASNANTPTAFYLRTVQSHNYTLRDTGFVTFMVAGG